MALAWINLAQEIFQKYALILCITELAQNLKHYVMRKKPNVCPFPLINAS